MYIYRKYVLQTFCNGLYSCADVDMCTPANKCILYAFEKIQLCAYSELYFTRMASVFHYP